MNVCFETFGCRLNRAEALAEEAKFTAGGHKIVTDHAHADLIVVRGCSVTARAQRDCEKLIAHIQAKYPNKPLVTAGCLARKISSVDRFLRNAANVPEDPLPTRTARAYLKVQDGCSGLCSFCIVPKFRGKSSSVDFTAVTDRAKRFIDAGYREIVVTGCNLSLYASQGKRLPELLGALADLSSDCRIRLGSLEPSPVARDTVGAVAAHANICRFLHIPVQSGSNGILAAMKRPYTAEIVSELAHEAVRLMPDIALGCDLIAGFPGESNLDHLATKGLLTRLDFAKAHVFPFSPRPGTAAANLPGAVSDEIRHARAHELSKLADESRTRFAKRFVGKTVEIVVEDERHCVGWTSEYLWCECPGGNVPRKAIARVRVLSAQGHVLTGKVIG